MKAENWTDISLPISSIIYNGQKLEETQVSIHRLMHKQIFVIYTYNGVVFSLKKGRGSDPFYSVDEPWRCYTKWNKLVTKRWRLYDSTYMLFLG